MPDLTSSSFALVILAAGGGRRLGGGKLLLPWRGRPILWHVLATAAQAAELFPVSSIILVLGHAGEQTRRIVLNDNAFQHPRLRWVVNDDWQAGLSGSLRLGLASLEKAEGQAAPQAANVAGAMVLLGDQVLVQAETLRLLAEAHLEALSRDPRHPATAPLYRGRRGNPVILSPLLFPEVQKLRGDLGARDILKGLGEKLRLLDVADAGVCLDLDTREDYDRLLAGER